MMIQNQALDCHTCKLIRQRDAKEAPLWNSIWRTEYWDVVHAYNTSLPGWLVLVLRRHITAVAEMTDTEADELGSLIQRVSQALQIVTGCLKTYVVQFAEQAEHPHVHFHIIPRMADLPEANNSTRIFNLLGVPPSEKVTDEAMNEIAISVRKILASGEDNQNSSV